MNVINMHKATSDNRPNKERLIELRESLLAFKESKKINHAMIVLKNCLSLVNDVIEYSTPIKLDAYYKSYAKSFLEESYSYFRRFEYDHREFMKNGLCNDLAPRFYCKNWFSTVVGVLELNGMTLEEIESRYYVHLEHPNYVQTTIFEFV